MDKFDASKAIELLDLDVTPEKPVVSFNFLGKYYKMYPIGYLPLHGEPATPRNLGEELKLGRSLTTSEAIELIGKYSSKFWHSMLDLETYTESMLLAQKCPHIFNSRKGTVSLTNTVAMRKDEKLKLGMIPIISRGEMADFLYGEFDATDVKGMVYHLDRNTLWPISPPSDGSMHVDRRTFSITDEKIKTASVAIQYDSRGQVYVLSNTKLDNTMSNVKLPLVKRV